MTKTYYICLIAVSGTGGTIGRELIDAFWQQYVGGCRGKVSNAPTLIQVWAESAGFS